MPGPTDEQLGIYTTLFRGRTDIYARRWEKNGKSGYSPAYQFSWNEFLVHKNKGGTMASFANKKAMPLTHDIIRTHLNGTAVVGIYPLLENNTSFFIAADFDGNSAFDEAKRLIAICHGIGLPSYLERSRSGNGAHVWLFFEDAYPSARSRMILLECIRQALGLSVFDKEVSFDRLFPNQDVQSGKGLGNLIALPLQGESVASGNSLFLNAETLEAYSDQWAVLACIKKISTEDLDDIFRRMRNGEYTPVADNSKGKLVIHLNQGVRIKKSLLDKDTVNFIREELNFPNLDYWLKKRLGKSVYLTEKFFRLIEETDEDIILPRGFLEKFVNFLRAKNVNFSVKDQRALLPDVNLTSSIELRPDQLDVVECAMEAEQGIIVAPAGSGKTIIGLEIIARRTQPSLILTHRKQIMDQWIDRIQTFLGIPKAHIGRIDGVKKSIGEKITVAMLQSLARKEDLDDLRDRFGLLLVDECHHIPAKTFREAASGINAKYCYGLTATPERKHNDEKLIYLFIGDIIAQIHEHIREESPSKTSSEDTKRRLIIRVTNLEIPFSYTSDAYQLLARIISFDQTRNRLILDDILSSIAVGEKTLVLSERKEHLEMLNMYLKGNCEAILITGDDSHVSRKTKFAQIQSGHYQVVLATGQLLGEGVDIPDFKTIILSFPLAFEGKLAQYIGRIRGTEKIVYDYRDAKTSFLDRQFKKRMTFYRKKGFVMK